MTVEQIKSVKIGTQLTFMTYGVRVFGRVTGIYEETTYGGTKVYGLKINHDQVQHGDHVIYNSVSMGSNLNTIQFI